MRFAFLGRCLSFYIYPAPFPLGSSAARRVSGLALLVALLVPSMLEASHLWIRGKRRCSLVVERRCSLVIVLWSLLALKARALAMLAGVGGLPDAAIPLCPP